MKPASRSLRPLLLGSWVALGASLLLGATAEEGFQSIFNGHDLTGWEGNPKLWSVQNGAITGQTTKENPASGNTFLIWKGGPVSDFELRFQFKLTPGSAAGFANSGVQYRSKVIDPANWVVGGYQADMEAGPTYTGILYEERGRGVLAQRGQMTWIQPDGQIRVVGSLGSSEEIQALIKPGQWNDYVILARGNHLTHIINGRVTVDVVDDQAVKAAQSGVLALQLHAGEPMKVQFRDLRLKALGTAALARSDLERMQGKWLLHQAIVNGESMPADQVQDYVVTIHGNHYRMERPNGEDVGTFTLRESTQPKAMDVTTGNGDLLQAIYAVNGDTMRVCYGRPDTGRPDMLEAPTGSERVLVVYHRAKD